MRGFLVTSKLYSNIEYLVTCYMCTYVGLILALVVLSGVQSIPPPKFGDLGPREGTVVVICRLGH